MPSSADPAGAAGTGRLGDRTVNRLGRLSHLEENVGAAGLRLSDAQMTRLSA